MGYSIRTRHFRYTEWRDFNTGKTVARELYDHRVDAAETVNVVGDERYTERIEPLERLIEKKIKAARR